MEQGGVPFWRDHGCDSFNLLRCFDNLCLAMGVCGAGESWYKVCDILVNRSTKPYAPTHEVHTDTLVTPPIHKGRKYTMALADQTYGFYIPTVSLMGIGCSKESGEQAKALGATKLLIVTDAGLAKMGVADLIKGYIEAAGLQAVIFSGAEPNPTDQNVNDGIQVYQDNQCDGIVSLGGGSSHDCGKGIGMVIGNGGNIRDFEGVNKSTRPMPPFLAINTTAGTASEMTRFCIITNTETHVKMAIVDWRCTPNIAINDPVLMVGKPPALTAATGMDALTHAVEAYVSTIAPRSPTPVPSRPSNWSHST
jgi:hypothetical protein